MKKPEIKTVLNIAGTAFAIAGTIITGIASSQAMKSEVAKQVAEEVAKASQSIQK